MTTILEDKVTIVAGALTTTWNDTPTKPAEAQVWKVDKLEGWSDTAEVSFVSSERMGIDGDAKGDFDSLRARHLIIGGYLHSATRGDLEALRDILTKSMPLNTEVTLTRHEPTPKFVRGYRSTKIESVQILTDTVKSGFGYALRWETVVTCLDPIKYHSITQTQSAGVAGESTGGRTYPRTYPMTYSAGTGTGNAVILNNTGTRSTSPVFTLTGPLTRGGWRVANDTTIHSFSMDIGLVSGDSLVLDFRQKSATLNGQPVFARVTGDFWKVVPGQNTIRLYADFNASAGISASVNSAWE